MTTPTKNVFISYSHTDAPLIGPVVRLLQANESFVFLDTENIKPGKKWRGEIETALSESNLVVLFWCKHADQSDEVFDEWTTAVQQKKDLLPLLLDSTPLPSKLEEFQWIDFRESVGASHKRTHHRGAGFGLAGVLVAGLTLALFLNWILPTTSQLPIKNTNRTNIYAKIEGERQTKIALAGQDESTPVSPSLSRDRFDDDDTKRVFGSSYESAKPSVARALAPSTVTMPEPAASYEEQLETIDLQIEELREQRRSILRDMSDRETTAAVPSDDQVTSATTRPSLKLVPPDNETVDSEPLARDEESLTREEQIEMRVAELEAADVPNQASLIEIRANELAALRQELASIRGEAREPLAEDSVVFDDLPADADVHAEAAADNATAPATIATTARAAEPSLVDRLLDNGTVVIASLMMLSIGVAYWRRRRSRIFVVERQIANKVEEELMKRMSVSKT